MSWRRALAIAAVAGGCARGGTSNLSPVDAPEGKRDAAHDAALRQMDAPAATCSTNATCATAMVLAGIGGDETGAASSSATGYQAAWLSIRISETDSSPLADPMSMQTTLTSPSGAMFDLLVYLANDPNSTDCTSPTGTVSTSGASQTSSLEWGETGTFANNADDSRTVTIQISPHAGASCSPAETWSVAIITGFK